MSTNTHPLDDIDTMVPASARGELPALLAGFVSAASAAAVFVSVATGPASAIPVPDHGAGPVVGGMTTSELERPCFMVRPRWNDILDGPQPRC